MRLVVPQIDLVLLLIDCWCSQWPRVGIIAQKWLRMRYIQTLFSLSVVAIIILATILLNIGAISRAISRLFLNHSYFALLLPHRWSIRAKVSDWPRVLLIAPQHLLVVTCCSNVSKSGWCTSSSPLDWIVEGFLTFNKVDFACWSGVGHTIVVINC